MDLELWKQRKKELNLNYYDIAKISGVPKTTVTNIFLGYVTAPRIDTVEAIEKALGLNHTKQKQRVKKMPNIYDRFNKIGQDFRVKPLHLKMHTPITPHNTFNVVDNVFLIKSSPKRAFLLSRQ